MKLFLQFFFLALLVSCAPQESEPQESSSIGQPDSSLSSKAYKAASVLKDTLPSAVTSPAPMPPKPVETTSHPPEKKVTVPADDAEIHRYNDGTVSVRITPWKEGKRTISLYDPKGALAYEFKDMRGAMSSVTSLSYREDGSVERAQTHENPGASRYMYHSSVTFSTDNEPQERKAWKVPQESLMDGTKVYTWDKAGRKWVLKEDPSRMPEDY